MIIIADKVDYDLVVITCSTWFYRYTYMVLGYDTNDA